MQWCILRIEDCRIFYHISGAVAVQSIRYNELNPVPSQEDAPTCWNNVKVSGSGLLSCNRRLAARMQVNVFNMVSLVDTPGVMVGGGRTGCCAPQVRHCTDRAAHIFESRRLG